MSKLIKTQKIIAVKDIKPDLENPRFHDKLIRENKVAWDNETIKTAIKEDGLDDIKDSIQELGVTDPIWVKENSDGTYTVIEGSRRLAVLEELIEEEKKKKIIPPSGVRYTHVLANIMPHSVSKRAIEIQRITLQTGKKDWGPYNEAYVIANLVQEGVAPKKIAKILSRRLSTIQKELESYKIYTEYVDYLKKQDRKEYPSRYTYFQRANDAVQEKFFQNKDDKKTFFELITPETDDGKARIPTVALKGGLYDFNTIATDGKILKKFLKNKTMSVSDALDVYEGAHAEIEFPWLKKVEELASKIQGLDNEKIERIRKDKPRMIEIKKLYVALRKILKP